LLASPNWKESKDVIISAKALTPIPITLPGILIFLTLSATLLLHAPLIAYSPIATKPRGSSKFESNDLNLSNPYFPMYRKVLGNSTYFN
jgi:hypothetical protein